MKFNKLVKVLAGVMLLGGGLFIGANLNTPAAQTTTAQAKTKSTKVVKVTYKKLAKKAYHVTKGTFYSTSKLTKANHYAVHYKNTTFYTSEQGTVKRANGKKAIYYYVKSSNGKVKGWIWHSYLIKGKAPAAKKTTTTTSTTKTPTTSTTTSGSTTTPQAPITSLVGESTSSSDTEQATVNVYGPLSQGNKILVSGTVDFTAGATAASVLQTLCNNSGVSVSISGTGTSLYVRGIDNLFEKDTTATSGWIYSVNGTFPSYSAGAYKVQSGDVVQWMYTETKGDRGWTGQ
ncbi:DUF4430 domain-containing protein [Secundilactobacillus paracollinoides]|uniref:Transcobalamin-like C-terminal domain-containing protein n=1 Tax=Secundilactobacillus paracollinoides TaxID=240427 RepID=A0A1B2IW92_9LACO|nr:DUF4430 domain-containing protein [Secundilactobacillus paracollinoides]ANZ60475.1 hypothetical protein AYR61_03365 [Secundilactobacillus paracollinoides]ANZ66302.1 hypothetical protein AYR63_03560 [Secundilactobacillus paracollinoides]